MKREASILIIGAGFSGLGMAIRLKQAGIDDFLLLERAEDLGGTWRDNTYPGCACDVESHLYSFSFAPNPDWSRMFSSQPEIQRYLQDCADRFGIRPHLLTRQELMSASWDDATSRWEVRTSKGDFSAPILISATGAFSEPSIPKIPGFDTFEGKTMHSARWDHSLSLNGKRIGVIGTGASAIQFIPAILPSVAKLSLFQRTPAWVIPRFDRAISAREQRYFRRFPALQKLKRWGIYAIRELFGAGFRHPSILRFLQRLAIRHLHRAITDPELRRKLTPAYTMGCKRILISNDYYPALAQPNIEVVTSGIREILPRSVVTQDGANHPVDVLIFGTGFQVTEFLIARLIHGHDGRTLSEHWGESPRSYLGTTNPGFPNFFMLLGPNTGLGHSSILPIIESQIEHVLKAIRYFFREGVSTLEARPEFKARYNEELEKRMSKTVWVNGQCSSWYLDKSGRNSTLWPSSIPAFRRTVEPFRPAAYQIRRITSKAPAT